MNNDDILRKIKACLARANSDNPHEAEISLNQAKRLMEMHGFSQNDVEMSDVKTAYAKGNGNLKPPIYEANLVMAIMDAFHCKAYNRYSTGVGGKIQFVGLHPNEELASYYFNVLFRQLQKARKQYIQDNLSRCQNKTKTRRADLFCEAWVEVIIQLIRKTFTAPNNDKKDLVRLFCQEYFANSEPAKTKDSHKNIKQQDIDAIKAGASAASQVQLNHGVNTNGAPTMLPTSQLQLAY